MKEKIRSVIRGLSSGAKSNWHRQLSSVPQEFTRKYFSGYSAGFFTWISATLLLAIYVAWLLNTLLFQGNSLRAQAIFSGQRVVVHVVNGDVEGNTRHTRKERQPAPDVLVTNNTPASSKEGLAPAPLESISMTTENGLVPMVGHDGTLPWKYYARPYKAVAGRPIVAVILTHLGLSKPQSEVALTLPHDFTLSFSPYASDAGKWAKKAREEGFETMVDLPMQSADFIKTGADPGPYGIMSDASPAENSARLRWILSRFPGFVGALAPENENLTSDIAAIRPTVTELTGHGVLFLYLKTPQNNALADLAKARQLYVLGIDKVIDAEIASGPIHKQLQDLTALAKSQGYAIGIAHSYPPTLAALSQWADALNAQGVDLVPVSAAALRNFP